MFAFATRTLYYVVQTLDHLEFNYTSALLEALFLIWWVIIPLTYMLFMHNRTFSQVLRQQRIHALGVASAYDPPVVRSFVGNQADII